jgi:DNA polymerase-3 subunit alpha
MPARRRRDSSICAYTASIRSPTASSVSTTGSRALRVGLPDLALTDLANVFGLVKFRSAARGKGIKPLHECDVFVANQADPDRPWRLLLLCRSRQGCLQLCELLSRACLARVGRAEVGQPITSAGVCFSQSHRW